MKFKNTALKTSFYFTCFFAMSLASFDVYAQKVNWRLHQWRLDSGTFSYRESIEGGITPFHDRTSWNSSPYTEGNLRESRFPSENKFSMNYRLLFPNNYDSTYSEGYPIILMLHGAGERGNCWTNSRCYFGNTSWTPSNNSTYTPPAGPDQGLDPDQSRQDYINLLNNDHNLVHGGKPHLDAVNRAGGKLPDDPSLGERDFPGFVVFPQNIHGWNSNQVGLAIRIMFKLIEDYNIDPNRVYIHGLSNGAQNVAVAIKREPTLFAAAALMSPTATNTQFSNDTTITHIPIWVFQGGRDRAPSPSQSENLIRFYEELGGIGRYTFYPTLGHGTWNAAYAEPDFFSWFLKQDKSNIHVFFGDSTLCSTNNNGVKLGLSDYFKAYQWEKDGELIQGANESIYIAREAGTYRARFSRISASPTENEWNKWSKPVVITETTPEVPDVFADGSTHLPDINGDNQVTIRSNTLANISYDWLRDDNLVSEDTSFYTTNNTGSYSVITETLSGCRSLESKNIDVFFNSPQSLQAPSSLVSVVSGSSSIDLFWNDNSREETGYEVYRSESQTGPYTFVKLLEEDAISFKDTLVNSDEEYFYTIRAVGTGKISPYVSSTSITTLSDTIPPSAPKNITVQDFTINNISISWSPAEDNTGVTNYLINFNSDSIYTNSADTTFNITGLSAQVNYGISIRALDSEGNISKSSELISVATTFDGLEYGHTTGAWESLAEDDPQNPHRWDDPEFSGSVANFNLDLRTQEDFFNFRFSGYLNVLEAGTYTFETESDDGSMLFIGGFNSEDLTQFRVVENDGLHGRRTESGSIFLDAGFHPITALFFERGGGQFLQVRYSGSDTNNQMIAIPDAALSTGDVPLSAPPTTPLNLTVSAVGLSTIDLSWQFTEATPEDSTGFEVYRSLNDVQYEFIGRVNEQNSFIDNNLAPGTLHYYKLKASNLNGSSNFTLPVSATTLTDSSSPTVPGSLEILSYTYTNAGLKWVASTDNYGVEGYIVYANGDSIGQTTSNTFYTTSLEPATNYEVTVAAYDLAGNVSASSLPLSFSTNSPDVFYSVDNSDLSALANWNNDPSGLGDAPSSFSFNGQHFIVTGLSGNNVVLNNDLNIGGNVSRIIVGENVNLSINSEIEGKISAMPNSSVNINNDFIPDFDDLDPNTTVNYNNTTEIPVSTYGNLIINGSGLRDIGEGTVTVMGNLHLGPDVGMKGSPNNGTTVILHGDLITNNNLLNPLSGNSITLSLASGSRNFDLYNDMNLFELNSEAGSQTVINNMSTGNITLSLGTQNGGGLILDNGSSINIGSNDLRISGSAVLNPSGQDGEIGIDGGNIEINTSTSLSSNLYFSNNENTIENLIYNTSTGSELNIMSDLYIVDAIELDGGNLNAEDTITLVSNSNGTSFLNEVRNGGTISGNFNVERFFDAKGSVFRYISSPVDIASIEEWQRTLPITGQFSGSSPQSGNTSMFYYDSLADGGEQWLEYPPIGSDNQIIVEPGRGYATFMFNGQNTSTLVSPGTPNYGDFSFDINGGSNDGSDDGWNLIGNPYPSDIVWNTEDWVSSGIGDVIYVRSNSNSGTEWVVWDRSTESGNLTNGIIPAGQAFWIQANSANPSLTVRESAKTGQSGNGSVQLLDNNSLDNSNSYFGIIISDDENSDLSLVKIDEDFSDSYEKTEDGVLRGTNYFFNVSTLSSDANPQKLVVNSLSEEFCTKTLNIDISNIVPGNYSLELQNLEYFNLANIELEDTYTSSFQNLAPGVSYPFDVNGDTMSFKDRFILHLSRPDLITSNELASSIQSCGNDDDAFVRVSVSSPGVNYWALNEVNEVISNTVKGNGGSILLDIDNSMLTEGSNQIRVSAAYLGCSVALLDNSTEIRFSDTPSFSLENSTINSCLGETISIEADISSSETSGIIYRWYNGITDEFVIETSNNGLQLDISENIHFFAVEIMNEQGCINPERRLIEVISDSLDIPQISLIESSIMAISNYDRGDIQWLLNGEPIQGANEVSFEPIEQGDYSVEVTGGSCSLTSEFITFRVTSNELGQSSRLGLKVFPNPSINNEINFFLDGISQENVTVEIFDLSGKSQMFKSFESTSSNVYSLKHTLGSGVYILHAFRGGEVFIERVIIR